jgi:hypothetical protein
LLGNFAWEPVLGNLAWESFLVTLLANLFLEKLIGHLVPGMAEDPKLALLGKNLFLEILNGNQLFLGTLLENLFLRALFLLATLLGNGSWDLAWEPFLETVLASGFEELNLAWEPLPGYRIPVWEPLPENLLGNLFLGRKRASGVRKN